MLFRHAWGESNAALHPVRELAARVLFGRMALLLAIGSVHNIHAGARQDPHSRSTMHPAPVKVAQAG